MSVAFCFWRLCFAFYIFIISIWCSFSMTISMYCMFDFCYYDVCKTRLSNSFWKVLEVPVDTLNSVSENKFIAWKSAFLTVDLWTCQRIGEVRLIAVVPAQIGFGWAGWQCQCMLELMVLCFSLSHYQKWSLSSALASSLLSIPSSYYSYLCFLCCHMSLD